MARNFRGRPSRRDQVISFNAATRFYAAAKGVDPQLQPVPPLRARVKRPVDGQAVAPLEKDIQKTIFEAI